MKRQILFYLLLFGALIHCPSVLGQQSEASTESSSMNYIPTPQTWAFIRYGGTPVDYYTGTAQVNVPIYDYKDNDFSLSISAGYASNGFQPQRQTGILGMNWFLNCGGSITREIRGMADDEWNEYGQGCILHSAFYNDARVLDLSAVSLASSSSPWSASGREVDADIFHFNFMGHSGTFHIDGQRKLCVYNTDGNHGTYEVTLQPDNGNELMGITVRTGDGYKYVFGGDESTLERSIRGNFTSPGWYQFSPEARHPIVTWFLREVTAPNGRKITFTYDHQGPILQGGVLQKDSKNPNYVVSFAMGRNMIGTSGSTQTNHWRQASVIRTSYLTSISVHNGLITDRDIKINLNYSLKQFRDATYVSNSDYDYAKADANIAQYLKQLDGISVTSGLGVVRQSTFTYRGKTLQNNRLILEKIDVFGVGAYKMSYYEPISYPDISTSAVDFWGYYNGRDDNTFSNIAPTDVDMLSFDESVTSNHRHPDWNSSITGCLKRIIYPTKGFTDFEYEPNRAKFILQRNKTSIIDGEISEGPSEPPVVTNPAANFYLPALNNYRRTFGANDETGGVRIRKIIDNDGDVSSQIREFEYGKGTVTSFPRFWSYSIYGFNVVNPFINVPANTFDKSHIGYDIVRERASDGSYVEYKFNDYRSHPDRYDGQQRKRVTSLDAPYVTDSTFLNNISRIPNSHHYQRGKLNCKTSYDKDGKRVRCERMTYADHNGSQNYSAYVVTSGRYCYSVKKFTADYRLIQKMVTDYFGQDTICTITKFTYNDLGQLCSTLVRDAEGVTRDSYIEYRHEMPATPDTGRHILNLPSMTYNTSQKLNSIPKIRNVTSATKYSYVELGNMIKPSKVSQAQMSEPEEWPFFQSFPSLIYQDKVLYQAYDTQGNPVQVSDASGVVTSYLWGYKGLYPVAKITGATYVQIKSALGLAGDAPLTAGLTPAQAATLRAIDGAYVDTYTYKPQVGVTEHTDPAGKTYTFEYDTYGRLIRTNDPLGQIQQYEYHL